MPTTLSLRDPEAGRVGGRKTTRGRKKNTVAASRMIKTEIQYSIQYKVTPINRGCDACGGQVMPLSGSALKDNPITTVDQSNCFNIEKFIS